MDSNTLKHFKVSVIIPALNEEQNIKQAISAVKNQDYKDVEIIVADNGSTDKTVEYAKEEGVKVVIENNKGTMWACEAGRKVATGDVIARLDADCIPLTTWISSGVKHFKDSRVTVVSGPYDYYDTSLFFRKTSLYFQKTIYVFVHILLRTFKNQGVSIGGNSFMRSSALKHAGGFNTAITFYGDDTDTAKRLSKYGICVFDRRLVMKTSGRRFKKDGILRLQSKYIYYFFKVLFRP